MLRLKWFCVVAMVLNFAGCAVVERLDKNKRDIETPAERSRTHTSSNSQSVDTSHDSALADGREKYQNQSKIVFLRSSLAASAVSVLLFNINEGEPSYLGTIDNDSQRHLFLTPGEHVFMAVTEESVDYLLVNALASRTYYSMIKPHMGIWKPRFGLIPLKSSNRHLWDDEISFEPGTYTDIITSPDDSRLSIEEERLARQAHRAHWPKWNALSAGEKALKTLEQDDGL